MNDLKNEKGDRGNGRHKENGKKTIKEEIERKKKTDERKRNLNKKFTEKKTLHERI